MGKTMRKDQRKNNKFSQREIARNRKQSEFLYEESSKEPKRQQNKKIKWKPHSEIEED